jgi:multidrug resistance efflux pump
MKAVLNSLRRFSLTGVMVLAALWAGYKLWDYYFDAPWTRDGHVRAEVVPIAPDVSGFVTEVLVKDNQQCSAATSCSGSIARGMRSR